MKLTEHVSYVGAQNPSMRVFDIIMRTEYGTSYNSYLVQGEKTAIIETVHEDYADDYLKWIGEVTPVSNIDYVILNHTEPDHTGSLVRILEENPDVIVIGSPVAIKNVGNITNRRFKSQPVKTGDSLDLGNDVVLDFIIAPNLHWPDSMFTYLKKDKVLFTCDVLGSHYCEPAILDKSLKKPDLLRIERKNYYDCIFGPFKKYVLSGLDKVKDLEFNMACTSHGPVLETYLQETIEDYRKWSEEKPDSDFIGIFYVSAYGYTKMLAEEFKKGLEAKGHKVRIYDGIENSVEEMAAASNSAKAVLFGSPTINRDALEPVLDVINHTDAINVSKKPALAFGSYGWSGEAVKILNDRLASLKYTLVDEGVKCVFRPSEEDGEKVQDAVEKIHGAIEEVSNKSVRAS